MNPNEWADTTRHERKRLDLTIGQCAELLKCSPARYSAIERGIEQPTEREQSELAWFFRRYGEARAAWDRMKGRP